MVDIESISNNLQENFEKTKYMITQGGFLGEIAFFNAHKGDFSVDVLISIKCEEFPQSEDSDNILNLYQLADPKKVINEFVISNNIKIVKSGILVEEYGISQVVGYFFCVNRDDELVQIQIFPGNFAIPILFGNEPELPEISKPIYIGPSGESEILENDHSLFYQEKKNQVIPLKKPKKVGRNDPCPCGSGIKYKKCCGKLVN